MFLIQLYVGLFLGGFLVTYLIIPRIIGVIKYKHLMDDPNQRSSHDKSVPSLGGISFYIALVLGICLLEIVFKTGISSFLLPGLVILFVIGLKDDLVILSPVTKIGAELLVVSFLLLSPEFQITELNGFLGFNHVSLYFSLPLSVFLMLTVINAFNLIDGIDGLASTVAIIAFSVLGTLFYLLHLPFFLGICCLMIGVLLAFLRYNLSVEQKIFMGDTGSLLIGFMISVSIVRLFSVPHIQLKALPFQLENLPLIIVALLIVPFFDTARVFAIRVLNKQDPFSPDRNHVHHLLIDYLKLSHRRASFLLGCVNVLFVLVFILLGVNIDNLWLLGLLLLCILFFSYFFYRMNFSYRNITNKLKVNKNKRTTKNKK